LFLIVEVTCDMFQPTVATRHVPHVIFRLRNDNHLYCTRRQYHFWFIWFEEVKWFVGV